MEPFRCRQCSQDWPTNYCPLCAATIEREPPAAPAVQGLAGMPPGADGSAPTGSLAYRHERPLFVISLTISIAAWLAVLVGTLGMALLYLPLLFLFYLFAQSALIAYIKGTAVKLTPRQFPDLHQRLEACCARLGITPIPECYLLHGDGVFNAFATRFLGRNFVVLYSDVVDALESRPGAVNWYLGHELGHIHRRHLLWAPLLWPASVLPLLGAAYRRAEEATCDNYGAACCDDAQDAIAGLTALAAGQKRWASLTVSEYVAQVGETSGFWMSFHELTSDYPWLVKRVARTQARLSGQSERMPRRNPFAYLFALAVPRAAPGGAGTSLVALALIALLIAAIAIPSLLKARMAANEATALQEVRTVMGAEAAYQAQAGHFAPLECLATPTDCGGVYSGPPLLAQDRVAAGPRSGYVYSFTPAPQTDTGGLDSYAYVAVPATHGETGTRAFCGDATGAVRYAAEGDEPNVVDGRCDDSLPPAHGAGSTAR